MINLGGNSVVNLSQLGFGGEFVPDDPAATTFFAEAESMSTQWQGVYNNLFSRVRARIGISKMKGLWHYKAPDTTTGKLNLFNPTATAAEEIGTPIWDYQGYKFNGTNQCLNSNYKPVVAGSFTTTNCAFGGWSVTSTAANQCLIGARAGTAGTSLGIFLNPRTTGNVYNFNCNTDLSSGGTNTDASGMYVVYRTDNTNFKVNKNGVDVATAADAANAFLDLNLYLGASNNNGTAGNFTANQLRLNFVCDGDVNFATLYEILTQFNTEANEAIASDLMTAYVTALVAQGGSLSSTEYSGMRTFYKYLLDNNYYSDIVDFGPTFGGNLAAGRVTGKLFATIANTNFVNADYHATKGFSLSTNNNKFLDTEITPTVYGLSKDDICVMGYVSDDTQFVSNRSIIGLNNAAGETELRIGYLTGMGGLSTAEETPANAQLLGVNSVSGVLTPFFELSQIMDDLTPPAGDFNTSITLFKAKRNGSDVYTPGSLSFWLVSKGVSKPRYIALAKQVHILHETTGRRATGNKGYFIGDSTTVAPQVLPSQRFSRLVAEENSLIEVNLGLGGTRTRAVGGSVAHDLMERYQEFANYEVGPSYPNNEIHIGFGINDMTLDGAADGTQALADARRDELITVVNYLKNTLLHPIEKIFVIPPGYTTLHNDAKRLMYEEAWEAACISTGAKFFPLNTYTINQGNPADTLIDTVHPNVLGHSGRYKYAHINAIVVS